eukprot:IDg2259t1
MHMRKCMEARWGQHDRGSSKTVVGARLSGATMLEVANAVAGERVTRSRKAKDRPVETPECSGGPEDLPEQADDSAVSWLGIHANTGLFGRLL